MNPLLQDVYIKLAREVPEKLDGNEEMAFSRDNLPKPPVELDTDRLVIHKTYHAYNFCFRVDMLKFYAQKEVYRMLGLLTLSVVFHPEPTRVILRLTHPASDIKRIMIEYAHNDRPNRNYPGYSTVPSCFYYSPTPTSRHPWSQDWFDPDDLPCFWLTNHEDMVIDEEQWKNRDTILGFGTDEAHIQLADLLLNASSGYNTIDEYELEGEGGFRGVGRLSAEVTLLLPGSFGWPTGTFDFE
ncbi:MAG: hypothetical protein AAGF95_02780 [Chloroflexota bacterium]